MTPNDAETTEWTELNVALRDERGRTNVWIDVYEQSLEPLTLRIMSENNELCQQTAAGT